MVSQTHSTFSVRLPSELHLRSTATAQRRGESLNALIQEALARLVAEEEARQLYEGFTQLGDDAEMSDVTYMFPAASEVMLHE